MNVTRFSKWAQRHTLLRPFSTTLATIQSKKAVVLGFYTDEKDSPIAEGTKSFQTYDSFLSGKLTNLLSLSAPLKPGKARVYFGTENCSVVSLVSLGKKDAEENNEQIDVLRENVRRGISAGLDTLKELGIEDVEVDVTEYPSAAAEGAHLAAWKYKETERKKYPINILPITKLPNKMDCILEKDPTHEWEQGRVFAEGQNFARHLMDSPSNLMTPTIFCNTVKETLLATDIQGTIEVKIRDKTWIEDQNMGAFLSVAKGSDEPPKFLEIHYTGPGCDDISQPLVLIGKGITFDCGGVSIKPAASMDAMRADMGGAANVSSAIYAAARLNAKGKVIGLMPLCENMVNGSANKPGDVITAKDGTTIQIDNTDAEGRLVLADAFCYAKEFKPSAIVDLATLTGHMVAALGGGAAGVFTNSDNLWSQLNQAGYVTGDRVWRMPIFQLYADQIKPSHLADINNVGTKGGGAGACTAAMFLYHFVEKDTAWAHLDIAGVMENQEYVLPYLGRGMCGRPVRTLAQFAGYVTGDRVWRMPIFQLYADQIKPTLLADINNVGMDDGYAGACTAAMFLNHFIAKGTAWAHLDIAGVMENQEYVVPYLSKGMGGRPTRTLTQFLLNYFG